MKRTLVLCCIALAATSLAAQAATPDQHRPPPHSTYQPQHDNGRHAPPPKHAKHHWARGQRVPDQYRRPTYVVNNYQQYHLRQPPRGYHWVRDEDNNYLLVAITTGIIADLLLNQH